MKIRRDLLVSTKSTFLIWSILFCWFALNSDDFIDSTPFLVIVFIKAKNTTCYSRFFSFLGMMTSVNIHAFSKVRHASKTFFHYCPKEYLQNQNVFSFLVIISCHSFIKGRILLVIHVFFFLLRIITSVVICTFHKVRVPDIFFVLSQRNIFKLRICFQLILKMITKYLFQSIQYLDCDFCATTMTWSLLLCKFTEGS